MTKVSRRSTEEKESLVRPEMVDYRKHMKKEREYAWARKMELTFELFKYQASCLNMIGGNKIELLEDFLTSKMNTVLLT